MSGGVLPHACAIIVHDMKAKDSTQGSKDEALYRKISEDLKKALGHLEYSRGKATGLLQKESLGEDDLESLEGFASRFARASDIAVQRFLRFKVLQKDPAFRGGVVDTLNEAEKHGWIPPARDWERVRELRNVTAHEYSESEFRELYAEILSLSKIILELKSLLT